MAIDPRTPVLVGAGQYAHHAEGLDDALDPVGLMCVAIDRARADAGLDALPDPDAIAVVSLLSWRYGDPAHFVAEQLGLKPTETLMTTAGGNSPQTLVNTTARDIQDGRADFVILTGGEAWRTRSKARKGGVELDWPRAAADQLPRIVGEELAMSHPAERARGLFMPVQIYPMFETAIRHAAGRSVEEQLVVASELWSRFSAVAAANENAWRSVERSAEEIRTPTPTNRMIGFPYTKYMNSNNDVDMGAALIMCSAERAEALGIDRDRWVFVHAGTDCHEHAFLSNRWSFDRTPAIELGARRALELAGMTIDDIDIVDLYSCFPSAVEMALAELGVATDDPRGVTATGGLAYAGGPGNSYAMHGIAAVTERLRSNPGEKVGLTSGLGMAATKHAFCVLSNDPARVAAADGLSRKVALPSALTTGPELVDETSGEGTIETYTVEFGREGTPARTCIVVRFDDGRRTVANGSCSDAEVCALMESEGIGRRVRVVGGRAGEGESNIANRAELIG